MKRCVHCDVFLKKRHQQKYCSNRCQINFQYRAYIAAWKEGTQDGGRGISTRTMSRHLKRYLIRQYGEQCIKCKWKKKHPIKGHVPLEMDHIDGNSENNKESNLRLLCPNCHSLTPNFKNLNRGKGRKWRKEKYLKNSSYRTVEVA